MCARWWATLKCVFGAGLLLCGWLAAPAQAQVQVGENVKMSLSGDLGVGYSGEFSNVAGGANGHGTLLQGQGQLTGSYYDPNFLSFSVLPYYNRNQDNVSFGSVFSSTGVDASVNLFSGSHFPGSVSYGKSWNKGSQYGLGIPGSLGLTADGTNQTLDITWSALFPKWPTLTATWADNASSDTILGETGTTNAKIKNLNLFSTYSWDGFAFYGSFMHQKFDVTFPAFLAGPNATSSSDNTGYTLSASHALPLHGNFTASYYHTSYKSDNDTVLNNGTADTVTGFAGISPTPKLSINGGVRYYNNLIGALQQSVLPPGTLPLTPFQVGTNGLVVNAFGSYNLGHGFIAVGYANHSLQHFQGLDYSSNQFGGTLTYNYARPLLGMLYFTFGMVDTGGSGNQGTLAAVANLGLRKQIAGWEINADASYAQNVQSSIAWFTTSLYNYGGYVRRRFGANTYWTASARDVRTGITQLAGYNTHSETYISNLTRGRYGISASYSQSNGTSVLTTSGVLVPTPLAPVLAPGELVYASASYGGTISVVPLRRMVVNASWFRLSSNTTSGAVISPPGIPPPLISSSNNSNRIYAVMTYKFRKLDFLANYWRVNQQISSSGLPRVINNNYSFTISRWFNVF